MPTVENSPAVVYANQGAQFITPSGDPIVPSELQQVVEEAGRKAGLEMSVHWLNGAWGTSCFVVKQKWPQGDKKWERVQCGELSPEYAFDVVMRFPPEMRTGDMVGMMRDKFGFVRDPRKEAERLMEQARKLLEQNEQTATDGLVEKGTQRILDESDHQRTLRAQEYGANFHERAHPMINGADFSEPKRLIPK